MSKQTTNKKSTETKSIKKTASAKVTTKKATKSAPKKSSKPAEKDYLEVLHHDLLTNNYTTIVYEKDFQFNAPNLFKVACTEPEKEGKYKGCNRVVGLVHFQEGPIKENGVNGIANEDAIGMVLKRLECFQESEYKCRENAVAITKLEEALMWLRRRTNKRVQRNVEGTSKV